MTLTVVSGERFGEAIIPSNGITWADLASSPYGSWENWTSWRSETGSTVEIQIDDDLGSVDYYTPQITLDYAGTLNSCVLKISTSGLFAGEETTLTFTDSTPVAFVQGRHYRWSIQVVADGGNPEPAIWLYDTFYASDLVTEVLDDVDIFADTYDSAGAITNVTTNLGLVRNIQATALQGDPYVVANYFIEAQDDAYVRTPRVINTTTPSPGGSSALEVSTEQVKVGGYSVKNYGNNAMYVDMSDVDFTGDWTFETWVWASSDLTLVNTVAPLFYAGDTTTPNLNISVVGTVLKSTWQLQYLLTHNGTDYNFNSSDLNHSQWYHIAVVRNGTTVEVFIDGTSVNSQTIVDPLDSLAYPMYISGYNIAGYGQSGVRNFEGYMDEIRISNTARYTSNFTVMTADHTNDADTELLIHPSNLLVDDGGTSYGTGAYILSQEGGSPVIQSKNPPQISIVNYNGDPWDGTVDLVLRGYPKIYLSDSGVFPVALGGT